jgi:hypothetical protein
VARQARAAVMAVFDCEFEGGRAKRLVIKVLEE